MRWRGRDARIELAVRPADFVASAALETTPQCDTVLQTIDLTGQLAVETLWILDPDICEQYWPGELCAPEMVGVSGVKGGWQSLKRLFSGG